MGRKNQIKQNKPTKKNKCFQTVYQGIRDTTFGPTVSVTFPPRLLRSGGTSHVLSHADQGMPRLSFSIAKRGRRVLFAAFIHEVWT